MGPGLGLLVISAAGLIDGLGAKCLNEPEVSAVLTQLSDAARQQPLAARRALYEALRDARVTVLQVGEEDPANLQLWADRDPVFGGVWIPAFSDPACAEVYAARVRLAGGNSWRPLLGLVREFFGAALDIPFFAGVRLDPVEEGAARLERHEVSALADGLVPDEAPFIHLLDSNIVRIPEGVPCRFGEADPGFGPEGRRVVFPAAPGLTLHDFRCLSSLDLGGAPAWVPCRNLAAALTSAPCAAADREEREGTLMEALVSFGMLGEAEALCRRVGGDAGRKEWALGHLARVLRRSGRLLECVEHCNSALEVAPEEPRLYHSLALAHAELENLDSARQAARRGLRRFPNDPTLQRFA